MDIVCMNQNLSAHLMCHVLIDKPSSYLSIILGIPNGLNINTLTKNHHCWSLHEVALLSEVSRIATASECCNGVPTFLGSLRNSFEYLVYIPTLRWKHLLNTRKRPRKLEENNHVFISDIAMTMGVDMRLNSSLTGALSAGTQQCRAWPPE